jgi:hypothetical protein
MAEREREKAKRERLEKHKRQLKELGKEREQDMQEKNRDTRQLIRELRQELHLQEEELQLARQREAQLEEQVIKEQRQKERHKTVGETWQARCKEKTDSGERSIVLEGEVKSKTRELITLGKQNETTCKMLEHEIQDLLQTRDQQAQVLSLIFVFFIVSHILLYLSKENERSITKLETKLEREKARKHAATTEEGVAVGLLLTAQQQLQAAEAQGQVCVNLSIS